MNKYFCLTMKERIDKIGKLLAKGVYLHLKSEREKKVGDEKNKSPRHSNDQNRISLLWLIF
ncbi:MAG: hypothetical protein L6416_06595 [Candidatus Omnitrophica bacterium]|nr:hypothetical protein [Candidatus Omnitrophota bacterium]